MVSFNCDGCGDVVKKPKLQQHFQRCYAPVTCLDCSMQFNSPNEFKGHNTCISEAEKYERSVYRGPKHSQQGGQANGTPSKKQQPANTPAKTAENSTEKSSGKRKRDDDEEIAAPPAATADFASPSKKEKTEGTKSEKKEKKHKNEKLDRKDEKEKSDQKEKSDKKKKSDKKEKKEKEKRDKKEKKAKKEKKQSESDEDSNDEVSTSSDSDADDSFDESASKSIHSTSPSSIHNVSDDSDSDEHDQNDPIQAAAEDQKIIKPLSTTELAEFRKKQSKLGIIYISRIPPGMTPAKVRHILSNFGELGRIYLQDGSKTSSSSSSSKRRSGIARYTEGWVEFASKKVAKAAAEMLNAQPIGGLAASNSKKSGSGGGSAKMGKSSKRFQDDVWTMKYLKGFKWHMLSEQMAQERASHAARLRTELSQSAYEQKDYLKKVERARVQRDKLERRKRKAEKEGGAVDAQSGMEKSRSFRQRQPVLKDVRDRAEA
ncbi:related to ESF2 - essential nucleolar protein involved in pre-18S rRNA processing [Melanopsichium pennsylvanicum]|uniref:18S rRNA factor 2 n=2 Tax=Melanopsichium pennsylvanicum TaxID=63383 RepID=A0AAJ4XU81_9BASI|nr:tbp-binding activator of basal transcription [Melanopsichium pennsylvanicum 4]SNX87623.1 related to ESF2 - essential nucleolar protein involved in pre-18S rRNA processing [Melanopsichium pennsylvanicum]